MSRWEEGTNSHCRHRVEQQLGAGSQLGFLPGCAHPELSLEHLEPLGVGKMVLPLC